MRRLTLLLIIPLMLLGNLYAWLRYLWCSLLSPQKAWRIAIGFDQLANVAANGSEDETISSRLARARLNGSRGACFVCRLLDVFEQDHCKKSLGV